MPVLSIEIKVNGQPVGTISSYRGEGYTLPTGARFNYPYKASFFPIGLRGDVKVYEGEVMHDYDDGMERLAALILSDLAGKQPT